MQSLLSIIHLLLVLTQNRIMPEMQAIWKAVTTEVSDRKEVQPFHSINAPAERSIFFRVEAINRNDKENVPPISNSPFTKRYNEERKKAVVTRRPSKSTKRYLVFCQLKTEG